MTVVYRYEKGLKGDDSDVWGWSCNNTVGEVQDLFEGVVDFRVLCGVQVGAFPLLFGIEVANEETDRDNDERGFEACGSLCTPKKELVGYGHVLTFLLLDVGKLLDHLHHRVRRTCHLRPSSIHHQTEAARAKAGPHR